MEHWGFEPSISKSTVTAGFSWVYKHFYNRLNTGLTTVHQKIRHKYASMIVLKIGQGQLNREVQHL